MAVGLTGLPDMYRVPGIRLGTARAGIKKPDRRDLVIMEIAAGAYTAAVFTRNAFCAAPVMVARDHLSLSSPRYLLINTGNANAGTGDSGVLDAQHCCDAVAELAGCAASEVLPFSTGVIGEPLPVQRIVAGLPAAYAALSATGWDDAAHGIMTTDTVAKGSSRQVQIDGVRVTVTGIAKGSGMIRPDMATMLAFIATDAACDASVLQQCLNDAVDKSFNRITVDGDTSTNDACVLIATGQAVSSEREGQAQTPITSTASVAYQVLCDAVTAVCTELAQAVIRDGEGATKLITVDVQGGASDTECAQVAYAVAHSPLVKTAFFACDPNWGRIVMAIGRAGVENLDVSRIAVYLGDVCIVQDGGRAPTYREELGQQVMKQAEITVRIMLGRGVFRTQVWTCDFSYDYVRINAEYRS